MPQGFFSRTSLNSFVIDSTGRNPAGSSRCGGGCKLLLSAHTPRISVAGDGRKGILIIAEAPDGNEDQSGKAFTGIRGGMLENILAGYGINMRGDCRLTYAVCCKLSGKEGDMGDRNPEPKEVEACRFMWRQEIAKNPPKLVILCGISAFVSYWGGRDLGWGFPMEEWRGMVIPDQENQCLVAHTFSLTDVLYSQKEPQILTVFKNDLRAALAQLQTPLPSNPEKTTIRLIKNPNEALDYLEMVEKSGKVFAFDYETTGLKPYLPQHKIVSLGLSCQSGEGVAFLLYPEIESVFAQILANPAIKKIAANLKFEHQWSAVKLGVEVQGWAWDTMLSSHILDYRTHIHSLKRQAFIQLGKKRWDRTVEKWLHAVEDSPNALNRIQNIHVDDLLFYNAMDAALEYRLACRQKVLIK